MTCEYAGELHRAGPDTDGPTAVWACHACPGGVLVLDPHQHQQTAHPQPSTTAAPPRIPAQRAPHAPATSKETV